MLNYWHGSCDTENVFVGIDYHSNEYLTEYLQ